jgi:2-methylcitrate dehydratase PrpD
MDPMQKIVSHIGRARYDDLSPTVVETVKMTILDTMGAALAGSASDAGRSIAQLARGYGGNTGSTVVVHGGKIAPPLAVLANGIMARCRELDGTHEIGGGHVGVCIVPAALALAEHAPSSISGKDVILAVALGVDMLCRLRMGAGKAKAIGWMAETMAPLSVAAMGAKLLGLSEREMLDAVGVAYALCSGNVQPTVEGAWSLWVPAGTAAAGGILAIDLARAGFLGPRHPLLGEFGLYNLYFRGEYDESQLLGQLGERNEILNSSLKPYPTCKYTHHAICTTLKLVEDHDLKPEQIKAVTVSASSMGATQCGFDASGTPKTVPPTPGAAQFSYPFTVATAIARRRVTLEDFTEDAICDPTLLGLARKVTTRVDPAKDALPMLYPPSDIMIETVDGKVYAGCEEFVKGHPRNPFTLRDCSERFMSYAAWAAKPIGSDHLKEFVTRVEALEDVKDAGELVPLLA